MEKIFIKNDLGKTIDNYEFLGLKNTLDMQPGEVLDKIYESNLRGRGGAGFPAGRKWKYASTLKSDVKFIVCNGDEGEPGTFKDRFIMENMPFKVLEGMVISGYATGAKYGYIYIRGEYVKSINIIKDAIHKMHEKRLLGQNILGSPFSFDLKLVRGAGAYVCGDETSLINSIEGQRGISRVKPPLPVEEGLYGKPTIVNNVETLSAAAEIMKYNDIIYKTMGTPESCGTKLVSISGDVNKPGVYEVEFGKIKLRDLIDVYAGGVNKGKLGFVLPGGIATACLTNDEVDIPYTYEDLAKAGSAIGSGGMIVVSDTRNYLEIVKNISDFFMNETCGTCFPCREGNRNVNILISKFLEDEKLIHRKVKIMEEIKEAIGLAARCGFGQASMDAIDSILDKFYNQQPAKI